MKRKSNYLVKDSYYSHEVFIHSAFIYYSNLPIDSVKNVESSKIIQYFEIKKIKAVIKGSANIVFLLALVKIHSIRPAYAKDVPLTPPEIQNLHILPTNEANSARLQYRKLQVRPCYIENNTSSTDFNVLVGLGSSLSASNNAEVIVNKIDFEKIRSKLTEFLETNQPHNNENLINSCHDALDSLTLYLKACLQPILNRYNIGELTLTSTNLMTETRSGLTGITSTGREVHISRQKLSEFMAKTGLDNLYPIAQKTLKDAHTLKECIEAAQGESLQLNIPQVVEGFIKDLPTTSEITKVSVKPCVKIKPLKAQLYGKFLDPFNFAASFDFKSQEFSLGVGKAAFYKLGNLSNNFGVIAGVDFGVNFRFTPYNTAELSRRFGVNAFFGLGLRF